MHGGLLKPQRSDRWQEKLKSQSNVVLDWTDRKSTAKKGRHLKVMLKLRARLPQNVTAISNKNCRLTEERLRQNHQRSFDAILYQ